MFVDCLFSIYLVVPLMYLRFWSCILYISEGTIFMACFLSIFSWVRNFILLYLALWLWEVPKHNMINFIWLMYREKLFFRWICNTPTNLICNDVDILVRKLEALDMLSSVRLCLEVLEELLFEFCEVIFIVLVHIMSSLCF